MQTFIKRRGALLLCAVLLLSSSALYSQDPSKAASVEQTATAQSQKLPASQRAVGGECSAVERTGDPQADKIMFAFSGQVHAGEKYACQFDRGLTFELVPTENGWDVAVREEGRAENLAAVTGSGKNVRPVSISGSDMKKFDPKKSHEELTFVFATSGQTENKPAGSTSEEKRSRVGHGLLKLIDVKMEKQGQGQRVISEMAFSASIRVVTVEHIRRGEVNPGITAPEVINAPDPEYSKEALKARHQGTVILWMILGEDGRPMNIAVARSLGKGLDEKAIEAVRKWRFKPAMKDGEPVPVQINVEVNFRLYR